MLRKSQNTFVAFHSTPPLHPSRFRFIQTPHCAIQLGFRNSRSHNIEDTVMPATHLYTNLRFTFRLLSLRYRLRSLQPRVICEQSSNGKFKQSLENPFYGSYHKTKAYCPHSHIPSCTLCQRGSTSLQELLSSQVQVPT